MSRFETLENAFELPRLEDSLTSTEDEQQLVAAAEALQKDYDQQDPSQLHDEEMDEIADLAVEYGKSLHDLGMNVEVKHAGEIFTASSNMLKIAVDARNSKMEKKIKLLRLELDRLKLDRTNPDPGETINAQQVTVLDRNALLAQIKSLTTK
jgi:hypothetical protein